MSLEIIEQKINFLTQKPIIILTAILLISVFLRVYYYPYNIPIVLDGQAFFWYASDMTILGKFPPGYGFPNNTWPAFLSLFFSLYDSTNFMDYMTIQRVVSISFSVVAIIPIYFLCRKFVGSLFALAGAAVFAFEPRVIQNSLLGLAEPLYVFLITVTALLFFNENKKIVYTSFMTVGLVSLVRPEGVFLFFAISIMFFVRYRKESKVVLRYLLVLSIFILTLLPMTLIRIDMGAGDPITGRLSLESEHVLSSVSENDTNLVLYFFQGMENPIKLTGWSMIPIFVFLLPLGFVWLFKKIDYKKLFLICVIGLLLATALYTMTRGSDTRYLLPLYPFFCILSSITVQHFAQRVRKNNLILVLMIGGILLSSSIFLDIRKIDYEHQREAFAITKHLTTIARGINEYPPENYYIESAHIQQFPILKSELQTHTIIIPTNGHESLLQYIISSKEKGLTHIIVDDKINRPAFLSDVFYHEERYSYLIKIFDSRDEDYKYAVKIFKINYSILVNRNDF
jgi:4-amino-4-deoxy-L-arabinose transferase-like glycosyltransferase